MSMILNTAWSDLLRKKASGIDECDLGEVRMSRKNLLLQKKYYKIKEVFYTKESNSRFRWSLLYFR